MHAELLDLVIAGQGVVGRHVARQRVSRSAFDRSVCRRELVQVLPSTYVLAGLTDDPETLRRAALTYAGSGAALSHLSALRAWGLPVPDEHPNHVSVPSRARPRAVGPVCFHRAQGLDRPGGVVERCGLPTVRLEQAVVESWPFLRGDDQRAPAIVAVQRRLTTPSRLRQALVAVPKLRERRALRALLGLLEQGCHSQLEIWGHLGVFCHPSLPRSRAQVPVQINGRTIYLDRFFEEELVDVELDGRKYHSSPADRERDLRRDAALAAQGIVVVRFSHDRIVRPVEVRHELLEILEVRRRQLSAA